MPNKINEPREKRIALALEEFDEFMEDEVMYLAEWWEIDEEELLAAMDARTRREVTTGTMHRGVDLEEFAKQSPTTPAAEGEES